jgi:glycosyltransferase involved in cell wall biosynthesis
MRACVLHDAFRGIGGGENVAIEIANTLQAPIYCCWKDTNAYNNVEIISFKQHKYSGFLGSLRRRAPFDKYSICFDFMDLSLPDYDIIIETNELCRGFIPKPHQRVILYSHETPFSWIHDEYRGTLSQKLQIGWWRNFNHHTLTYIDVFISNSELTQQAIKRYLGKNSIVIYPPVDTKKFFHKEYGDYYLTITRLSPDLKVHELIEQFKKTDQKLKIVGSEWDKKYSRKVKRIISKNKNVEYVGEKYGKDKIELLSRCKGVILSCPQTFGITTVEALASGKPVIGFRKGYTPYQIKENINGMLINSIQELPRVLERFENHKWRPSEIQQTAQKYDISVFRKKLKEVVRNVGNM